MGQTVTCALDDPADSGPPAWKAFLEYFTSQQATRPTDQEVASSSEEPCPSLFDPASPPPIARGYDRGQIFPVSHEAWWMAVRGGNLGVVNQGICGRAGFGDQERVWMDFIDLVRSVV